MGPSFETKACSACAKAKRKCTRALPSCSRCSNRGLECWYPDSQFVELTNWGPYQPSSGSDASIASTEPGSADYSHKSRLPTDWFTFSESWRVTNWPRSSGSVVQPVLRDQAEVVINHIYQWLVEWVQSGRNPFIHAICYKFNMPECVQDAYSTFASYMHHNSANEAILARILDNQVNKLLSANKVVLASNLPLTDHVARVHALLVYQMLGLYGNEAHQRMLAESRIPLLNSWMNEMLDQCSQTPSLAETLDQISRMKGFTDYGPIDHLWCTWILSETVRRTWLVCYSMICLYESLSNDKPAVCEGGVMFTTRKGAWEAPTAEAWEELGLRMNFGLMRIQDAAHLLQEPGVEDVDVLARVLIEVTYG